MTKRRIISILLVTIFLVSLMVTTASAATVVVNDVETLTYIVGEHGYKLLVGSSLTSKTLFYLNGWAPTGKVLTGTRTYDYFEGGYYLDETWTYTYATW